MPNRYGPFSNITPHHANAFLLRTNICHPSVSAVAIMRFPQRQFVMQLSSPCLDSYEWKTVLHCYTLLSQIETDTPRKLHKYKNQTLILWNSNVYFEFILINNFAQNVCYTICHYHLSSNWFVSVEYTAPTASFIHSMWYHHQLEKYQN